MSSHLLNAIVISILLTLMLVETPVKSYPYGVDAVYAKNGMVVSTNEIASRIGAEILGKGGNAVDAAVAVGFALAVVHPAAGNIGGGGFMLILDSKSGKVYALDFRETAPAAARQDMYLKPDGNAAVNASRIGYLAAGVPGTVKGFDEAYKKFGLLEWADLIEPAIKLAEEGFNLTYQQAQSLNNYRSDFESFPSSEIFICTEGRDWQLNDIFKQKNLTGTLKRIANKGPDDFYNGDIAEKLCAAIKEGGGIITPDDLASYKVIWREPLKGEYNGNTIYGMPLPSSGTAVLLETLNIIKNFPIKEYGLGSTDYLHILSEALRRSFMDRSLYMGDMDFVDVPIDKLVSEEYAKKLAANIMMDKASDSKALKDGTQLQKESENTTHYAVSDKWGNVVCVTYTLNSSYGSKAVAGDTGVLLNNEMDDFCVKPGYPNQFGLIESKANAISPGKRMLSSMTPLIIIKDGEYFLTIGSPGGPTIISSVLQTFLNIAVFDMNIQEAVNAPRIHHQWLPDEIMMEKYGFAPEVRMKLQSIGHILSEKKYLGDIQVIMYLLKPGLFLGASDPRMEGRPVGN
jgi:gamma-glutamyltranspeptidase/glutathione hydrolase